MILTAPCVCPQLYFIWITGSQRHFEWLIDIMREVEEIDKNGMVDIDIFITQFFQNFDLRTALLVRKDDCLVMIVTNCEWIRIHVKNEN